MKYIETILAICTILPAFGYFYDKGVAVANEKTTQEINIGAEEQANTKYINPINKSWTGSYKCSQGVTDLNLSLFSFSKSAENEKVYNLTAQFDFKFNTLSGSYLMSGTYNIENKSLTLKPNKWIKQPSGYEMVPLDGVISADLKSYSGIINHQKCDLFKLTAN